MAFIALEWHASYFFYGPIAIRRVCLGEKIQDNSLIFLVYCF